MFNRGINMKFDFKGVLSVIIAAVLSGIVSVSVATAQMKAHIENSYVHKDTAALEQTFVRKDVLTVELKAMNDKLNAIAKEMGLD